MVEQPIALATGLITLLGIYKTGNKNHWGWAMLLGNQILWFAFIVAFGAWGLLPLSVTLTVVYTRNFLKWRSEENAG